MSACCSRDDRMMTEVRPQLFTIYPGLLHPSLGGVTLGQSVLVSVVSAELLENTMCRGVEYRNREDHRMNGRCIAAEVTGGGQLSPALSSLILRTIFN